MGEGGGSKREVEMKRVGTVFSLGVTVSRTVPSSFAGESVDLIKKDDGGSDGPRLPKHLQVSATMEKREAERACSRDT